MQRRSVSSDFKGRFCHEEASYFMSELDEGNEGVKQTPILFSSARSRRKERRNTKAKKA